MKVIKFGGTSVGSVEGLQHVKAIVAKQSESPVVVVVSAISGMTDLLIHTSHMAAAGEATYEENIRLMRDRHIQLIKGVFPV